MKVQNVKFATEPSMRRPTSARVFTRTNSQVEEIQPYVHQPIARQFPPLEGQPRQPQVASPRAALECEVLKLRQVAMKRLAAVQRLASLLESEQARSDAVHARNLELQARNAKLEAREEAREAELEAQAARHAAAVRSELEVMRTAVKAAQAETQLARRREEVSSKDKVQIRLNFDPVVVKLSSCNWIETGGAEDDKEVAPSPSLTVSSAEKADDGAAIRVVIDYAPNEDAGAGAGDGDAALNHFVAWLRSKR